MRLSFFISLCISLFGVLIVQNLFSSSGKPDQNIYLGYIGIIFVAPFIILSLFITYRYFYTLVKNASDKSLRYTFVVASLLLLISLAYFSLKYKGEIVKNSDGFFPPLNENTYQVYLNFYTFALVHTISAFFGSLFGMIKFKSQEEVS